MTPTIFRKDNFRYFFNSREETRMHVHVAKPDGTAKFWLELIVSLADYYNFSTKELKTALQVVEEKQHEFIKSWKEHFSQ
jgi:hypothetical protein